MSIKIWDAETGDCLKTLNGHTNLVLSVCFSNNDHDELTQKIKKLIH